MELLDKELIKCIALDNGWGVKREDRMLLSFYQMRTKENCKSDNLKDVVEIFIDSGKIQIKEKIYYSSRFKLKSILKEKGIDAFENLIANNKT